MSAKLNFTLSGGKLAANTKYGATFEWQGVDGGVTGGISTQTSTKTGRVTFPLNPEVFVAIAQHRGPGILTLAVTHEDGSPLGPGFTISEQIA